MVSCQDRKAITMAILGSSNAAGMGASTYHGDPTKGSGWSSPPTSWAGGLVRHFPSLSILNFSVSGSGSDWALDTVSPILEQYAPEIFFLCTNPIADHDDGTKYYENAKKFIAIMRDRNIAPIVRGAYPYNGYTKRSFSEMLDLNVKLSKLDCLYVDHMTCLADKDGHYPDGTTYAEDGLHPTDAGHAIFLNSLLTSKFGSFLAERA